MSPIQTQPNTQRGPAHSLSGRSLLHRLEAMDEEPASHHSTLSGSVRWMIPYADMMTLLLGLFLVLYSMSQTDPKALSQTLAQDPEKILQQAQQQQLFIDSQKSHIQKLETELNSLETQSMTSTEADKETTELDTEAMNYLLTTLDDTLKSSPNVTVQQQERGLVISLKEQVLFSPGEAKLTETAKHTLDQLAKTLANVPQPIRVEGHTDNTPIKTSQFPSNWELSTARATNIIQYLVVAHHFDATRLSAAGYGEFKPLAENSTIEGKQKNRRVDIVVLNTPAQKQEPTLPAHLEPKASSAKQNSDPQDLDPKNPNTVSGLSQRQEEKQSNPKPRLVSSAKASAAAESKPTRQHPHPRSDSI